MIVYVNRGGLSLKEKVIKALYDKKGEYISGEELAAALGVSRTAVWKHINQIKLEGYSVESSKKGYRIAAGLEKLLPMEIKSKLGQKKIGDNIIHFDSLDSTNNYAKKIASEAKEGTIIISEEQLSGRGRLGRNWCSPMGAGIWMSIILKPLIPPAEASRLTQVAAAAVCNGIRQVTGLDALIKWPNDLVVNGKKVCGILTEMAGELNEVSYIIVGIGINVNTDTFPEDLEEKATSLYREKGKKVDRIRLISTIIDEFADLYYAYAADKDFAKALQVCRQHSAILGRLVYLVRGEDSREQVLALDITEEGLLKVKKEAGEIIEIASGEVSIRGEGQYV